MTFTRTPCFTSQLPMSCKWAPLAILFKVVGHMLGQKNVSGIAAIHHSLGQVDSRARYVRPFVHVDNTTDRPAVDSHPHPQPRMVRAPADLNAQETGASGVVAKTSAIPSPVGRRVSLTSSFGFAELLGCANNLVEFYANLALLFVQELGVTDDVDEEDMRDLKLDLLFNLSRHATISAAVRLGEFLEARIIPERIEHRIEPEQRGSKRHASASEPSLVSRAVSVKRRWRGRALPSAPTRGQGSRSERDRRARLSRSGLTAMAFSARANAAALSPRAHIGQREIANEADNFPAVL